MLIQLHIFLPCLTCETCRIPTWAPPSCIKSTAERFVGVTANPPAVTDALLLPFLFVESWSHSLDGDIKPYFFCYPSLVLIKWTSFISVFSRHCFKELWEKMSHILGKYPARILQSYLDYKGWYKSILARSHGQNAKLRIEKQCYIYHYMR